MYWSKSIEKETFYWYAWLGIQLKFTSDSWWNNSFGGGIAWTANASLFFFFTVYFFLRVSYTNCVANPCFNHMRSLKTEPLWDGSVRVGLYIQSFCSVQLAGWHDAQRLVRSKIRSDWHRIWSNLHAAWVPDTLRSQWYMAIHDILPTKERLHRIALADTAHCIHCGQLDTLSRRLINCGARKEMWRWTQGNLATMLHTHSCRIPYDWHLCPCFSSGPLRGSELYCGSWPILSIIECNTPLHRSCRT